jgi:sporulation integral membrane protein YlbJ
MKYILATICVILIALLLMYPADAISAAKSGFYLWYSNVLPVLMPFFIFTGILSKTGMLVRIGKFLAPLMKPFGLDGRSAPILLMGALSGYPIGAKLANTLRGEQAQRAAALCNLCSPMFMIGTVGAAMLGSAALGVIVFAANLLAAILFALFLQLIRPLHPASVAPSMPQIQIKPIPIIIDTVNDSVFASLRVGAYIMLFMLICTLLEKIGLLTLLATPLRLAGLSESAGLSLVTGILEMTSGCSRAATALIPIGQKVIIASALTAFGGFSIIMQSLSFCEISAGRYILHKFFQAVLASLIAALAIALFPTAIPVLAPSQQLPSWESNLLSSLTAVLCSLLALALCYLLSLACRKKSAE